MNTTELNGKKYQIFGEDADGTITLKPHVNRLKDLEGPRPTRAHIICQNGTVWFLMFKLLERAGYENRVANGPCDKAIVINVEKGKIVSYQTPDVDRPGIEINHPLSHPEETLRKLSLLVDPLDPLDPLPRVRGKHIWYDHLKAGFDLEPGYTVYTPTLRRIYDLMHQTPCVTDVTLSLGAITRREYQLSRTSIRQMLAYADAV